jgi:hypothetical protein
MFEKSFFALREVKVADFLLQPLFTFFDIQNVRDFHRFFACRTDYESQALLLFPMDEKVFGQNDAVLGDLAKKAD